MLEKHDDHVTKGTYIDFRLHGFSPSGKTKIWVVQNREDHSVLGRVSWFGRWRKYIFHPPEHADLVFEEVCLREIAQFIEEETKAQRAASKAAKA
jgi:hypothetical protein